MARLWPGVFDLLDGWTFHVEVPTGASSIEASLDFISPAGSEEGITGGATATDRLAVVNWNAMLLYPERWTPDDLTYSASLHLAPNWKFGTSLAVASRSGAEIQFVPVSLTMLVDGPVLTGEYLKIVPLNTGQTPPVEMDVAADSAAALEAPAEVWEHYRNLIAQTNALFGAPHYRDYHFLYSLSDHVAHFGLEHHESNDSRLGGRAWSIPRNAFWVRDCCRTNLCTPGTENTGVPSPAGWGANAGGISRCSGAYRCRSRPHTRTRLTQSAGHRRRRSRDAGCAPSVGVMAAIARLLRRRGNELAVGGHHHSSADAWPESLDDFCRIFHGPPSGPPQVRTYTFDDIVNTLNQVAPYDWRGFWTERLTNHGPGAPLGGIEGSGWKLVYDDIRSPLVQAWEGDKDSVNGAFSIGLWLKDDGLVTDTVEGLPAARAGIGPGMKLVAVNGRKFSKEVLADALRAGKNGSAALELLVENTEYYKTYMLDYHGGEKFPHLVRDETKPDLLTDIIKPR